jgi:putative polyhydroxyalkanoate system protein
MADIRIHRDHQLGLPRAREIAAAWAKEVESKFDMVCTMVPGEDSDTMDFKRTGATGRLIVGADHFELTAKLGFLLGAFSKTIEAEITQKLDGLLAQTGTPAAKG